MSTTVQCVEPWPSPGSNCLVTVTVADSWSRDQFGTYTTVNPSRIIIGTCSLCGGEVNAPQYWSGAKPAARCTRCHATEAPPKLPVIEMVAPYVTPAVTISGLPLSQSVDALLGDSVP